MTTSSENNRLEKELQQVRQLMLSQLSNSTLKHLDGQPETLIDGGKMLRARLTLSLAANDIPQEQLHARAAGIELLHAASLLHDDVIDGAHMRRYAPTFWEQHGRSGAILFGDSVLFFAMRLFNGALPSEMCAEVIDLAGTMCQAEVNQELITRTQPQNWDDVLATARNKTGALFACAALLASSGTDEKERAALREAGYLLGTAYQICDDYLDAHGHSTDCGKTLGLDALRSKNTAANAADKQNISASITTLLSNASAQLASNPSLQQRWDHFVESIFDTEIRAQLETAPHA